MIGNAEPVLAVRVGMCSNAEGLAAVEADLVELLGVEEAEVTFSEVPACEAPAFVLRHHGIGGALLGKMAENPHGFLVFATTEVPGGSGKPCPCCEKPL